MTHAEDNPRSSEGRAQLLTGTGKPYQRELRLLRRDEPDPFIRFEFTGDKHRAGIKQPLVIGRKATHDEFERQTPPSRAKPALHENPQPVRSHVAVALVGDAGHGEQELPHDAVLVSRRHCPPQSW